MNDRFSPIRKDTYRLHLDNTLSAGNQSLLGRSGVDGAIHRAGGPQWLEA